MIEKKFLLSFYLVTLIYVFSLYSVLLFIRRIEKRRLIGSQERFKNGFIWFQMEKLNSEQAFKALERMGKSAQRWNSGFPLLKKRYLDQDKGSSQGEKIAIEVVRDLFPSSTCMERKRYDWLRNPETGYPLELDAYWPDLSLAVEYNGKQHYEFVKFFHKNQKKFYDQIKRDNFKYQVCSLRRIFLLIVPFTLKKEQIPIFVYSRILESFLKKIL